MDYRKKQDGNVNFHKKIDRAFPKDSLSFLCAWEKERQRRGVTFSRVVKNNRVRQKNEIVSERGITLLALIITVVIMIILAAVTLNITLGDGGLIDQAKTAAEATVNSAQSEQEQLDSLEQELANLLAEPAGPPGIGDIKPGEGEPVDIFENTTEVKDDLDNSVWIPGGFGVAEDSGTKVEEGIVIEDGDGNQFVWIPTGTYNVSTFINASGKLTNNLSRRTFTTTEATEVSGDDEIQGSSSSYYFYGEGDSRSVASGQIGAFKASAESVANGGKGGFYIGRYEVGTEEERTSEDDPLTMPIVQANKYPYVYITRDQAKSQIEAMYNSNNNVESELISSYAWDTALNFICQTNVESGEGYNLAMTTSKEYANINTGSKQNTGAYAADNYSNIHDFLGNCLEWTTEYYSSRDYPCVLRGGYYNDSHNYAAHRNYGVTIASLDFFSARALLYLK